MSKRLTRALQTLDYPDPSLPQDAPAPILRRSYIYLKLRLDIADAFDLESQCGRTRFVAWLYTQGVADGYPLTEKEYAFLNRLFHPFPAHADLPPISHRSHLLYLAREDLTQIFHLETREGYIGFLRWLYTAPSEDHFLTHAELQFLAARSDLKSNYIVCSEYGKFVFHTRPDLQKACDLGSESGRTHYLHWIHTQGVLDIPTPVPLAYTADGPFPSEPTIIKPTPPKLLPPTESANLSPILQEGVDMIGFARAELGTGEDTRTVSRAIYQCNFPVNVFSINPDALRPPKDFSIDDLISEQLKYRVSVFNTPAYETTQLLFRFRQQLHHTEKYLIGYWAWELSDWKKDNSFCIDFIDEIWASTQFTQASFEKVADVPVFHMPLPVTVADFQEREREYFHLPKDQFLFLYIFDFNSSIFRKNPWAAVKAFQQAFTGNSHVGLVIKTMCADPHLAEWREFLKLAEDHPNIYIINEAISRSNILALMKTCDAYISLHRAEGFGRTMAEAMLLHKPVLATNYSGNTDFCKPETCHLVDFKLIPIKKGEYPNSKGQIWADANADHAAQLMKLIYQNTESVQKLTASAYRLIDEQYSERALGPRYAQRLKEILKNEG